MQMERILVFFNGSEVIVEPFILKSKIILIQNNAYQIFSFSFLENVTPPPSKKEKKMCLLKWNQNGGQNVIEVKKRILIIIFIYFFFLS